MRTRKLYDLLSRVSPSERKLFAEFLRSPLHAHRPKLAELVELMEKMLFQDTSTAVSHEEFHAAYYPGKPYDANNLNRLLSTITTEFKKFLGLLSYQQDRGAQIANTVREYGRRHWNDLIPGEVELAREQMKLEVAEDEHYYYQMARVEHELALWKNAVGKYQDHAYMQLTFDYQDLYSAITKARAKLIDSIVRANLKIWHTIRTQEPELDLDTIQVPSNNGILKLFRRANEINNLPNTLEVLQEFRKEMLDACANYQSTDRFALAGKMSRVDAELFMQFDWNYLRATSIDREVYNREYAFIQKAEIENGICFDGDMLPPQRLVAYVRTLVLNGNLEKAKAEADRLAHFLHHSQKEGTMLHISGYLLFLAGNNRAAISQLVALRNLPPSSTDARIYFDSRVMLGISWYRLGDIDAFSHEVAALRILLSRKQHFQRQLLQSGFGFIRTAEKIIRAERRDPEARKRRLRIIQSQMVPPKNFAGMAYLKAAINAQIG